MWDDIGPIQSSADESLGYPTEKPLALLECILSLIASKGESVLDAFCGCGTALVAAQRLLTRWIGIDLSRTACRVMAQRLKKDCGLTEGKNFVVCDLPSTESQLRRTLPFEFENWAVIALSGIKEQSAGRETWTLMATSTRCPRHPKAARRQAS